jgi:hypothetical protein
METLQLGVPRCRVRVSVPLHPDHLEWADLSTDVVSVQLLETLEVAALGVHNSFIQKRKPHGKLNTILTLIIQDFYKSRTVSDLAP